MIIRNMNENSCFQLTHDCLDSFSQLFLPPPASPPDCHPVSILSTNLQLQLFQIVGKIVRNSLIFHSSCAWMMSLITESSVSMKDYSQARLLWLFFSFSSSLSPSHPLSLCGFDFFYSHQKRLRMKSCSLVLFCSGGEPTVGSLSFIFWSLSSREFLVQ